MKTHASPRPKIGPDKMWKTLERIEKLIAKLEAEINVEELRNKIYRVEDEEYVHELEHRVEEVARRLIRLARKLLGIYDAATRDATLLRLVLSELLSAELATPDIRIVVRHGGTEAEESKTTLIVAGEDSIGTYYSTMSRSMMLREYEEKVERHLRELFCRQSNA